MAQPQPNDTDWRNQEIKIDPFIYQLAAGICLIIIATLIGFALFPNGDGYLTNLYTTGIGVLITIAYLDRRAERREALRAEADLKARLIREMGSQVNEVAIRAVEELRAKGWLEDGSLIGKNFFKANLQRVNLREANMKNSILKFAYLQKANLDFGNFENIDLSQTKLIQASLDETNLKNADLEQAKIQNTSLGGSNLQDANLKRANLQYTDLDFADMQRANLLGANLHQVDLGYANLNNANLKHAILISIEYNEFTILPDGTNWSFGEDMTRFTDPNHPQFWRSDNSISPAFPGNTST